MNQSIPSDHGEEATAALGDAKLRMASVLPNLAVRGTTLASKFAFTIVMARWFTPADVGVYGLLISALAISNFVFGLEYYWFTMRELMGSTRDKSAEILRDQLLLHVIQYAVAAPCLLIIFNRTLPHEAFYWFCVLVIFEHLSQEAVRALIALGRPLAANLVLFCRAASWVYPVIAMGIVTPDARRLSTVFVAWLVGLALSLGLASWHVRTLGWSRAVRRRVDWPRVWRGVRIAAPFLAVTASTMVLLFVDRFIIVSYIGVEAVGVFSFYAGITTALHQLINTSVTLVGVRNLVRAHDQQAASQFRLHFRRTTRAITGTTVVLAVVAAMSIHPILDFIERGAYKDAVGVYWGLLAAAVIRTLSDALVYALYASRRDREVVGANALAAATSVGLNLLLVPRFGLAGATWAALGGSSILFVTTLLAVVRRMPFLLGSTHSDVTAGCSDLSTSALPVSDLISTRHS